MEKKKKRYTGSVPVLPMGPRDEGSRKYLESYRNTLMSLDRLDGAQCKKLYWGRYRKRFEPGHFIFSRLKKSAGPLGLGVSDLVQQCVGSFFDRLDHDLSGRPRGVGRCK